MKKNLCEVAVMLSRYFLIGFLIQFIAFNTLIAKNSKAQLNAPIHANLQNVSVRQVFDVIKKSAHVTFVYDADVIDTKQQISISGNQLSAAEVLNKLVSHFGLAFKKIGHTITIKKKDIELPKAYDYREIFFCGCHFCFLWTGRVHSTNCPYKSYRSAIQ